MALSDQERKLLEQLEASLTAEDPKFAETLRGDSYIRIQKRRATLAGLGFVVGVVALVGGMQVHPAVSIVGFVVMLASAILGLSSWRRVEGEAQERPDSEPTRPAPAASERSRQEDFMNKLEERWRRRQEGDDA